MATLLFSAIGTALGGPIGGAIGALVGQQLDSAIIGSGNREGPRLKELNSTTSSYGSPLPRHIGRMRVPGSIIWATELAEHKQRQGGGKGRPSVTTYSYTASFAVALASRPIREVGRIWADGNLLRGASGDLKVGGTMRVHSGWPDQPVDPLIAAHEGHGRCPAFRGVAYVVFDDLELGDFFNRIPSLTFEVIADDGPVSLSAVVSEVIAESDAAVPLDGIEGLSCEGAVIDSLRALETVVPLDCDAAGERLVIARERLQVAPMLLPEAAISVDDNDFGGLAGHSRSRGAAVASPPEVLRYYDIDRDYQPGLQRAIGRAGGGQPRTVELPVAMTASTARALAQRTSRRSDWSRDRVSWRTATLNPQVVPGAIVSIPEYPGRWRVIEWEWRASGVELALSRVVPAGAEAAPAGTVDPGRVNPPLDLPPPPTILYAFEVPWDGSGSPDLARPVAALSSSGAQWRLSMLLRGRGGTENAVNSHMTGERFVLLDEAPVPLDPAIVGAIPGSAILATGRGDPDPVASAIAMQGATLRPLFPVHPRISGPIAGDLTFSWTRRARGAWDWPDGVETPLQEQAELYQITFGPIVSPLAVWQVSEPRFTLSAAMRAQLAANLPGGALNVRQQGSYALSEPLFLASLI